MDGWAIWWQSPLVFVFFFHFVRLHSLKFISWKPYNDARFGLAGLGLVWFALPCLGMRVLLTLKCQCMIFRTAKMPYITTKWSFSRCSCSLHFTVLCAEFCYFYCYHILSAVLVAATAVAAVRFYIASLGFTESGQRIKFQIHWRHKKARIYFAWFRHIWERFGESGREREDSNNEKAREEEETNKVLIQLIFS